MKVYLSNNIGLQT